MKKEEPLIRGTRAERAAVPAVTVVFAVLYMLSLPAAKTYGWSPALAVYLMAGAEIVIIALFRSWNCPAFRAVPLIQYTAESFGCALRYVRFLDPVRRAFTVLTLILLVRACVCMVRAQPGKDAEDGEEGPSCKLALLLTVVLDLFCCFFSMMLGSDARTHVTGFAARTLFAIAVVWLGMPDTVLLNVKRLSRLASMWLVTAACVFGAVRGTAAFAVTFTLSARHAVMLAALVSTDVLAVGCLIRYFMHQPAGTDGEESLTDRIARCFRDVFAAEGKLTDGVLERDYLAEYSYRLMNDAGDREKIRQIRDRLRRLREERRMLMEAQDSWARLAVVEAEAADLLEELSICYGIRTGFDTSREIEWFDGCIGEEEADDS